MDMEPTTIDLEKGLLGNAIRSHRIALGLTQEALAEAIDITPTHLKHLESEHRKPSVEVLFRLVKILHISLDDLLLPEKNNTPEEYKELLLLMGHCTNTELQIGIDLLKSLIIHRQNAASV